MPKPDASPAPDTLPGAVTTASTPTPPVHQRDAPPDQRDYLDDDFAERAPMPIIDVFIPGKQKWGKFQVLTSRELEEITTLHRESVPELGPDGQPTGGTVSRVRQAMYAERIIARAARKPDGRPVVVGELDPGVILYAERIADSWRPGDIIAVSTKLFGAMGISAEAVKQMGKD
jgi:hypothetical protein